MKAAVLFEDKEDRKLVLTDRAMPEPKAFELLIEVKACALCRTDLHILDHDIPARRNSIVLGHEIVGQVKSLGSQIERFKQGDLVGVPWLARTCLVCDSCKRGAENLCDKAEFTGYTVDGGFAEYTLADARFCFPIPETYDASHAAPLLCAGLIGYRCLSFAGDARNLGIYGFGAAAHVVTQLASSLGKTVFAFTSPSDESRQNFAKELGAKWAGGSDIMPPELLDAAIIFAPAGHLVPQALKAIRRGGVVVCGGIHMSNIPEFPYELLWGERSIKSVANLTRADGDEFFRLVAEHAVVTRITEYELGNVNDACNDLRHGKLHGAAVIIPGIDGIRA